MFHKKSQIWIETVLYTLIALIMIGTVIAIVKPKIEEIQDKAVIEQTIELLENIDGQIISAIKGGVGNTRLLEMGIKRGLLKIDGETDKIIFEIDDSRHTYSEPGAEIPIGNIIVRTEKKGKLNKITLTLDYSEKYNLKFEENDVVKTISKTSTSYKLLFSNLGREEIGGETFSVINVEIVG